MEDNDFISKESQAKLNFIRPLDTLSVNDLVKYKRKLEKEILVVENEIKNKEAAIVSAEGAFKL